MRIEIRGRSLGQGRPWLCAPLVGRERERILQEAAALSGLPVDMGEWRYDLAAPLEGGPGSLLPAILEALGDKPLIFTYRTPAEKQGGGPAPLDYAAAILAAAQAGADLVDIEWNRGQKLAAQLGRGAREAGCKTVFSCHDFLGTPSVALMVQTLLRMEDGGGDVVKLAVTPQTPEDVLALLTATQEAGQRLSVPLITMSMGRLGMASRLCGGLFGSCLTFGAAARESAPGQPPVEELARTLGLLYGP